MTAVRPTAKVAFIIKTKFLSNWLASFPERGGNESSKQGKVRNQFTPQVQKAKTTLLWRYI